MNPNDPTTLRWLIDNRWSDAHAQVEAQKIIDRIVGFPAAGRASAHVIADAPSEVAYSPVTTFRNGDLPPVKDVVWMVPPSKTFPIVGAAFSSAEFLGYLRNIKDDAMTWAPRGVTIHHTAAPSLATRPRGFESQHMLNLRSWYQSLGWDRGPHLFVDDKLIWVFSPLTSRGIHAVSFNRTRIGIEILGDFDSEDPKSGRGLEACKMAADAASLLIGRFGLTDPLNFHRDDSKTSKTCPGSKFQKDWFLALVREASGK